MSTTEEWREVFGFRGKYSVSSLGRVMANYGKFRGYPKLVAGSIAPVGYRYVYLCIDSKRKRIGVHQLVAQAFIRNHQNKPQVNHKNCVKTDNRVENLEWATGLENTRHAYANGLIVPVKGVDHPRSKLSIQDVRLMREAMAQGESGTSAAKRFGVSQQTASDVFHRKVYTTIP